MTKPYLFFLCGFFVRCQKKAKGAGEDLGTFSITDMLDGGFWWEAIWWADLCWCFRPEHEKNHREERRNTTSTNKIRHHGVDTSSPMFWIQWYDWKVSTQILMDPMLKPSFVRSWDSRPFLQRNWTRDISQWGDALISAWLQLSWGFPTVGNWFLFLSQPYQLIELLALIHWFPQESLVSSAQSTPMPMPQDICTKRRDLHGEGQGYEKRCMLIYVAGPDLG